MSKKERRKNVVVDFLNIVRRSWSWKKLSKKEKERFTKTILSIRFSPKGNCFHRWNVVSNYYAMFLKGCGLDKPESWRDK